MENQNNSNSEKIYFKINDLIDFEAKLNKKINENKEEYFFRGQFDWKWKLESTYRRQFSKAIKENDNYEINTQYLIYMINKEINYINTKIGEEKNILDIFSELQHASSPTILIDFTSNFWTAIWFAVSEFNFGFENNKFFHIYYFKLDKNKNEKYSIKNLYDNEVYRCSNKITNGLMQNSYFILDNSDNLKEEWNIKSFLISTSLKTELLNFFNSKNINFSGIFSGFKGINLDFQQTFLETTKFINIFKMKDFTNEDYDYAINRYNNQIKINSKNTMAYFKKGNTLIEINKFQEAIECYDKAIELDPNNISFYFKKGNALDEVAKYNEAIECYDKALLLEGNKEFIYADKGKTLNELGKYKEAIECYDKAIKINPTIYYFYTNKANVFCELEKYDEAIKNHNKAIELDPTNIDMYANKLYTLFKINKYDEAMECINEILKLDPNNIDAYNNKGIVLYIKRKYDEALKCFNKVLNLNSTNEIAIMMSKNTKQNLKISKK